ncbi:MAG: molybdopterin-guanine dinucleotide biosynthesis protein B [Thermoleophilia bacterium]
MALAIQCGGESRRMGGDKALLPFAGGTLLEWVRDRVTPLFEHVFIVARDVSQYGHVGLPVVTDALQTRGSAVGVYTAIAASPEEHVLCLACDMPFVPAEVLLALAEGKADYQVYVPRHGDYMQPLCAVYSRSAGIAYHEFLMAGRRRIDSLYPEVSTGYFDVGDGRYGDPDTIFMNVNTPVELEAARRRAEQESGAHATPATPPLTVSVPDPPEEALGTSAEPSHPSPLSHLSPRIRSFMERVPVPTVSFVGKKKSGKTTVLEGVIAELARRGRRVAVFKHDLHGFDVDIPGTDSYRLREAGAMVAGISSPEMYVLVHKPRTEPGLEGLIARIGESVDVVITEGFKREAAPKVEISRRERSTTRICTEEELIGVASDQRFTDVSVPQLGLDDFAGLADLVESRIISGWPGCRRDDGTEGP